MVVLFLFFGSFLFFFFFPQDSCPSAVRTLSNEMIFAELGRFRPWLLGGGAMAAAEEKAAARKGAHLPTPRLPHFPSFSLKMSKQ